MSPTNNNNTTTNNNTLSSDYSDDYDDDDCVGGIHSFYAIHESSDGYHHEGRNGYHHSFKFNHQHLMNAHNHNHNKSHRVFRNSHSIHSSSIHHKSYHHRYKNKRKSSSNSNNAHNHNHNHNVIHNGSNRGRIPISFKYQHNIHNMIHNLSTIIDTNNNDNTTTTNTTTNNLNLNMNLNMNINGHNNDVIFYDNIKALQIFSSYSEKIRISTITYLMRSISYLGIDINIQKQYEIHKLQELIYCKQLSPHLNHLSITDFKDVILIPNRINSLVIQRWFTNLSNLQFESQFFHII